MGVSSAVRLYLRLRAPYSGSPVQRSDRRGPPRRCQASVADVGELRPNRGGTTGSLLLVNHWVETTPAPRVTLARRVNAHDSSPAASSRRSGARRRADRPARVQA